ncbi:MAG TPA: toll/interleukin-1 receptor domain-containing protein [Vicinamibacterales bacterium]|jgi:hypothetical protein|nr:toll/interleukin-1 receptor domain-containing protein [Vicinamibacterales bacterium]
MSRVFISYRHEDAEDSAGRLYDTLAVELGADALFMDVEKIAPGRSWKRAVREALADSAAVLVVMGPQWQLSEAIELELELALASDVPVVPVMVRKADLVQLASGLRGSLAEIAERKAVTLSHASWARDCQELVEVLKRVLADPARARVLIEPPNPRVLLDESRWPSPRSKDALLMCAQDLAECLGDPEIRKLAERSYVYFDEEVDDEYRRRHNIPTGVMGAVQQGLQRLSIEQYVLDLLDQHPGGKSGEGIADAAGRAAALASTIASIGDVIGDPAIGEKAWNEVKDIKAEISEMAATRGDGGSPEVIRLSLESLRAMLPAAKARLIEEVPGIDRPGFTKTYTKREWPIAAFGNTKQYGRDR